MTDFTDLPPAFQRDCEAVWALREAMHADGVPMTPVVGFFQDDERPALIAHVAQVDVEMALHAARMGMEPVEATWVTLHADATRTTSLLNPLTGQPWQHGEMQTVHESDMLPMLSDSIVSFASWPDGRVVQCNREYRVEGDTLVWSEPEFLDSTDPQMQVGGRVPRRLREAWHRSRFEGAFTEAFEMPEAQDEREVLAQKIAMATYILAIANLTNGVVALVPPEYGHYLTPERIADVATTPLGLATYQAGIMCGYVVNPMPEMVELIVKLDLAYALEEILAQSESSEG